MAYFIEFTSGDISELITETTDKTTAVATWKAKQVEYKSAGKHGIIACYEITTKHGVPMRKCYDFWDV